METPKRQAEGATPLTGRPLMAVRPRRREKLPDKQRFIDLIAGSEDWLMRRILDYAQKRDYVQYTAVLAEAWRLSIAGLSAPLLKAWQLSDQPPELGPNDDYHRDPIAVFGMLEAQRHRARGVSLSMFLGLMKYYRQSYHDLVGQAGFDKVLGERCRLFIDWFFDRMEIGFCTEWAGLGKVARDAELQKEAEREIQRLASFPESNPNPVMEVDASGAITYANPATVAAGISQPEAMLPPDLKELMQAAGAGGARYCYREVRINEVLYGIDISFPEQFPGARLYATDISARRQMEEQLELKGRLLDRATDLIYLSELDGALIYCNESMCSQLGYGRDELMRKKIPDMLTPEYQRQFKDRVKLLRKQGEATFETEYLRSDGSVLPVEVHARLLGMNGGTSILSVSRDISERRAAAAALIMAAQKWRITFDAIKDSVFLLDRKGRIIQANRALADLVKKPFSKIIGNPCWEVVHNATRHIADCPLVRMWESRRREVSVIPAGKRWLKAAVDPIFDEAGEVTAAVHTVIDITDSVRAESDLRNSLEKLQRTLAGTVSALASTVATRDPYTAGHQRGVASLASAIAQEMGFTPEGVEGMRVTGSLHDIGKIAIPAEILSKPGKINAMEFNLIKGHAQEGHDILKAIEFPWPVAQAVLQHHERLDGSGYPLGIKDGDIIPEAKILMVADVVEAMASHRPYRPALGIDVALEEIVRNKGTLYDPGVVEACVRLFTGQGYKFF